MNIKLPLVAVLATLVYPTALQAATWTVDNNAAHNANFSSLQAAIDAASEDDTLLVAGSGTSYGDITSNKRLKIRGPGYFQAENGIIPHLGTAQLGTLTFRKSQTSITRISEDPQVGRSWRALHSNTR